MTLDEAITHGKEQLEIFGGEHAEFIRIAIRALEMQKALAVCCSGMDICKWVEDYDYEENNISDYEYEISVDDFLIDEAKEGEEGMTNGDMIKAMFPDADIQEIRGHFEGHLLGYRTWLGGHSQDFSLDWWNTPYRRGGEE